MKCKVPIYHSVFFLVLGIIVGTASILYFTGEVWNADPKEYLDGLWAFLTFFIACIAVWINFKHLEWQKESRVWELNKGLFIDLFRLLNLAIEYTETAIYNELELNYGRNQYGERSSVNLKKMPNDDFLALPQRQGR